MSRKLVYFTGAFLLIVTCVGLQSILASNAGINDEVLKRIQAGSFTEADVSDVEIVSFVSWITYDSIDSLSQESQLIIRGEIVDVTTTAKFVEKLEPEIRTIYTINVKEVYKGDLTEKVIAVSQLGGTYRGLTYNVEGSVLMNKGEAVILFLNKLDEATYALVGGPQGIRRVVDGAENILQVTK